MGRLTPQPTISRAMKGTCAAKSAESGLERAPRSAQIAGLWSYAVGGFFSALPRLLLLTGTHIVLTGPPDSVSLDIIPSSRQYSFFVLCRPMSAASNTICVRD